MVQERKPNKRVIINKKDRTTAIILAIFLGLFAWIYTYKLDKGKFWAALIVNIFLWWTVVAPVLTWILVIIDMSTKSKDKFTNYHKYKVYS